MTDVATRTMTDVATRIMTDVATCPKEMQFGPCAGMRLGGECEIPGIPCPFLARDSVPAWSGAAPSQAVTASGGLKILETMQCRPIIITDIPTIPLNADTIFTIADKIRGSADAYLIGDHGGARVQFPPAYRAMLMKNAGLESWVGFNCRDRNRVALESEAVALAHLGVAGVNCVTGDHTLSGHRADAKAVFDLDSTRLAALARAAGLLVSVGEKPNAIPTHLRAERLAQKVKAGAHICMVNMPHSTELVSEFKAQTLAAGADVPFVIGIPVMTSLEALHGAVGFYNLQLPHGLAARLENAKNIRLEGIKFAIEYGHAMLGIAGVRGLNLSGLAATNQELEMAQDFAEIGREFL